MQAQEGFRTGFGGVSAPLPSVAEFLATPSAEMKGFALAISVPSGSSEHRIGILIVADNNPKWLTRSSTKLRRRSWSGNRSGQASAVRTALPLHPG